MNHPISESPLRVDLYRALLSGGHQVLALDYRGFGDSSAADVTESSMVEDAARALHYTRWWWQLHALPQGDPG